MKKYSITITESSACTFTVEANSAEEARELWFKNGDRYEDIINRWLECGYCGREISPATEVAGETMIDFSYDEIK
jgi:hypothetical protein